jgi:uncharacterized protein YfaT (DUF1175 family)/uncharacterized protein YfaP (DUF2135 family)
LLILLSSFEVTAKPSTNPEVLARRGQLPSIWGPEGQEPEQGPPQSSQAPPTLTLTSPREGWTSAQMVKVQGQCSDPSVDPIVIDINGIRYYARSQSGGFVRSFPLAAGRNTLTVRCSNAKGTASLQRNVHSTAAPIPLKAVLSSDTDGVYTDLHVYEPDGTHVYWASTRSPSGGLFFLNQEGENFDQSGYGPYVYAHAAPPIGTFRIDANYWPGGAFRHTAATLDLILFEGTPQETRRRVRVPLAKPDETRTLAYVTFKANQQAPEIFVPGQDPPAKRPQEPPIKKEKDIYEEARIHQDRYPIDQDDLPAMRRALVQLAMAQLDRYSPRWDPPQRDCAGLVRFVYREALAPRSLVQRRQLRLPVELMFPSVGPSLRRAHLAYPKIWLGPGGHTEFADAETLIGYNFQFKSRELSQAQAGDLLVFRQSLSYTKQPMHLMLYVPGPRPREGVTVYHTGGPDGSMRLVRLRELLEQPEPTFRPRADNPEFLGVYQWNLFRTQSVVKS